MKNHGSKDFWLFESTKDILKKFPHLSGEVLNINHENVETLPNGKIGVFVGTISSNGESECVFLKKTRRVLDWGVVVYE